MISNITPSVNLMKSAQLTENVLLVGEAGAQ